MSIITLQELVSGEMIKIRSVKDPKVELCANGQIKITQVTKWIYLENGDLLPDKLQDQLNKPQLNQIIDNRYCIYRIDKIP